MKLLSALALTLALGLSFGVADAEAKRLGSGKSSGMQRQMAPADKTPNATPAQAPAAASAAAPAAGAAAAAAAPKRSWMGPVAGLAAGLGLAALASHFGFGEAMANMLMIGLLVMAVIAVIGFVMRKRAAGQAGASKGMGYATATAGAPSAQGNASSRTHDVLMPRTAADAPLGSAAGGSMIGSAIGAGVSPAASGTTGHIPADFDTAAFERSAKVQFIRLQAANDSANLDDIRAFTTPEMFAEIKMDMTDRGQSTQHTDVVSVDARVLDVAQDAERYTVSVRFSGQIREDNAAQAEDFVEIWHLTKPVTGQSGWLLSGIQQATS